MNMKSDMMYVVKGFYDEFTDTSILHVVDCDNNEFTVLMFGLMSRGYQDTEHFEHATYKDYKRDDWKEMQDENRYQNRKSIL